jgi:hypothetical protein
MWFLDISLSLPIQHKLYSYFIYSYIIIIYYVYYYILFYLFLYSKLYSYFPDVLFQDGPGNTELIFCSTITLLPSGPILTLMLQD